jgi:hypothetical protein
MNKKDFASLVNLINDLDWERDRMTSDGRETLEMIWKIIMKNSQVVRDNYYETLKEQMFKAIN